jgi:hypothetical protein
MNEVAAAIDLDKNADKKIIWNVNSNDAPHPIGDGATLESAPEFDGLKSCIEFERTKNTAGEAREIIRENEDNQMAPTARFAPAHKFSPPESPVGLAVVTAHVLKPTTILVAGVIKHGTRRREDGTDPSRWIQAGTGADSARDGWAGYFAQPELREAELPDAISRTRLTPMNGQSELVVERSVVGAIIVEPADLGKPYSGRTRENIWSQTIYLAFDYCR